MRLRASKRKLSCDDGEVVADKKALLSGDTDRRNDAIKSGDGDRLNEAISSGDGDRRNDAIKSGDGDRLNEASSNGDLRAVREILRNKNRKVSTLCLHEALLKAVEAGKKQIVWLLLSHGVSVKGKSEIGCSALIAAAKQGNLDIVKSLIKRGACVNQTDSSGRTVLMTAVVNNGCIALITFLLEKAKAKVNLQDKDGKTVLMLAVEQWDYETVQILFLGNDEDNMKDYKCDEGIKDKNGHTALDLAKLNGSGGLMNILSECRKQSCSPLTVAAGRNDLNLVRQLVEIHPSCVDTLGFGACPLPSAMHGYEGDQEIWDGDIHCSYELIECLVNAGVDVDDSHLCGLTPLMFAAMAGSVRTVKLLLLHKADMDCVSMEVSDHNYFKRRTALLMAAQKGRIKIVNMLIEAGAKVDVKDCMGETALCLAIQGNHIACVLALLKKQKLLYRSDIQLMAKHRLLYLLASVEDRWNELFENPSVLHIALCLAVESKCYQLVRSLVKHGADVNSCDGDFLDKYGVGPRPLKSALDDENMLALLVKLGANINFKSEFECTALMTAASNGNKTHVCNLLKCNADMYAAKYGKTALSMASGKGHAEIVTTLLDHGMDVNHVVGDKTALWSCVFSQNNKCVETLIKNGADVNFAGLSGVTVLMLAVERNSPNLEQIIKSGADVNAQDVNGNTALFYALQTRIIPKDAEEKVSLLLKHGANVNHLNLALKTPLMVAARLSSEYNKVFKVLLDSQPELDFQDTNGETAVHIAARTGSGDKEKLEMLASKGANLNIVNNENRTPLLVAFGSCWRIVKPLVRLGATMNEHNSRTVGRLREANMDYYISKICRLGSGYSHYFEFMRCSEALFESACTLRGAVPPNLDILLLISIKENEFKLLKLLVKFGAGPDAVDLQSSTFSVQLDQSLILDAASVCNLRVSPMCLAILVNQPKTVALFAQTCFYDREDVKKLQHPLMKQKLKQMNFDQPDNESCTLDDLSLCPKKWSLRTWSKLAVLRAVGYGEGREQRVKALPIPRPLQDELLYKNVSSLQEN